MITQNALRRSTARLWERRLSAWTRDTFALLGRQLASGRAHDRLVVFLPMLILPTVQGSSDLLLLTTLYLVVTALDAALWPAGDRAGDKLAMGLGAFAWLVTAFLLGTGAGLALALFVLARVVDSHVPASRWLLRLALAALAAALLVDLALVALALERSSLWLALAAAIGAATAAARGLAVLADGADDPGTRRAHLTTALIGAASLVLALYGALLAHEPVLRQLAGTTHYLALPLLAAALVRLGWLGLAPIRAAGVDRLGVVLLALWALAGLAFAGAGVP